MKTIQAGKLPQHERPQAGTVPLVVYAPQDIADLASARQPGPPTPFLVPAGAELPANGNGHHPTGLAIATPSASAAVASDHDLFRPGLDLLRALATVVQTVMSETSQTSALFVSLPEAAAVSGLSQTYLRRKIADGTLKAEKDRGWKIRRKDLEAL